jgi:hypothetical protein
MKLFQGFQFFLLGLCSSFSFAAMEFKAAEITTLKNMVEHDPGSGAAPARVNEKIGENSKVTTSAASMAELTFADASITRLGANSLFSFQSKERLIKLEKGSILVNTPPGNGGATVDCGGVTGAVSGTTFMASRDVSGNVMFVMLEGTGVLKVTLNTPTGAVSKEIRPGQAATVGGSSTQASAASGDTPGGGGDAKTTLASSIQVFDVDVKKIVESAPLIREFQNDLPSVEKIEQTIEKQQSAVKEGKLEKLEVEVVAVKGDGDVLVGAPRVDPADMKVVNRKDVPDPGLDIDTAAGPGEGTRAGTAPAPLRDTPRVGLPPPPSGGNLAGITATEAGGLQELPPTQMTLKLEKNSFTVTLNRRVLKDREIKISGFPELPGTVTIGSGSSSFTLALDSRLLFPGFVSADDPTLKAFSIQAVSGDLTASTAIASLFPLADLQAANPARRLPSQPKNAQDLAALDAYFYFSDKVAGVTGGPSAFFDSTSQVSLQDVAFGKVAPVELRVGQDFVFHAAGEVLATPGGDALNFAVPTDRTALVIYGDKVSIGTTAAWTGLDWVGGIPPVGSLNYKTLNENKPYAFVFNQTPGSGEPTGFFDSLGDLYFSAENFPVWNDEGGFLEGAVHLKFDPTTAGAGSFVLAAGEEGFRGVGLSLDARGGHVELQSIGDLELTTSLVSGTGATTGSDPTMRVEATGTVKIGGAMESEQVRFEGATMDTAAGLAPAPGSLAVIRSETALELRNLTIRSFDGTRLEKTGANSGRILLSGSTVRDFKIKELTGMAVNADAKIQMMAVNDNGQLDGEMQVEGSLPVATKLASAIDATVAGDLGNKAVHANDIDLAARRLELNNATLTAMNSITARANTLIIQNSFMTVVRGTGMINFYVGEGLVNRAHNTTVANQLNFWGKSTFQLGANSFSIASSGDIAHAISSGLMIETSSPQAGKVNVMPLGL